MFTLAEIKEINKKYKTRDFQTIEPRKKDETTILLDNLSEEEILNEIQSDILLKVTNFL